MFTPRESSEAAAAAPGLQGSVELSPVPAELGLTPALLVVPHLEPFWRFIPCLLLGFSPFILKCSQNVLQIEAGGNLTGLCGLTAPLFSFGPPSFCCTWWYHRLHFGCSCSFWPITLQHMARNPDSPCLSPAEVRV